MSKTTKKVRRKTNNSQVHRNSSIITTNYRKDFPSLERRGEGQTLLPILYGLGPRIVKPPMAPPYSIRRGDAPQK
jgi:hypothetical protein